MLYDLLYYVMNIILLVLLMFSLDSGSTDRFFAHRAHKFYVIRNASKRQPF